MSPPGGLLEAVKADGGRRRANRHRRNLGVAVLALALVAVPAVTLQSGDDGSVDEIGVAAGGDGSISTVFLEPVETTVPADTVPVPPPPGSDAQPAPPPPPDGTPTTLAPPADMSPTTSGPEPPADSSPTTLKPCRNSADASCGAFRWDPAPAPNKPLVASFKVAPSTAVAGQPVAFEVAWSDGDAQLTIERFSTDGTALATSCSMAPRYGPWTPPPVAPGSGTLPYQTTFAEPGTYKVTVTLGTADCTSPYGNDTLIDTTVTVTAAATTG